MRILCATDLQPKSDAAIGRAGMLADQLGAGLTLLHVAVRGDGRADLATVQYTGEGPIFYVYGTRSFGLVPLDRFQPVPSIFRRDRV